jgi:multisubunit Na+/H+ antiporter MnhG subunit
MIKDFAKWFFGVVMQLHSFIILFGAVALLFETINLAHANDLMQRYEMVAGCLVLGVVLWVLARKLKKSSKFKPDWQSLIAMLGSVRVFWFIRF